MRTRAKASQLYANFGKGAERGVMSIVFKLAGWLDRKLVVRRATVVIAHVAIFAMAYIGAYLVRFDFEVPDLFGREAVLGMGIIAQSGER